MTYLEAAIAVLQENAREMTTREITDAALSRGLLTPGGRTPARSMEARLYTCVRSPSNPGISKVAVPGVQRARRGSVRWAWRP